MSALDLAQRITFTQAEPFEEIKVNTLLKALDREIGETVNINDALLDLAGGYRILEKHTSLDNGSVTLMGQRPYGYIGTGVDLFTLEGRFLGTASLIDKPIYISYKYMYFLKSDEEGNYYLVRMDYKIKP